MSIASEITSMGENLKKDYQSIANLGADLTNVDKNIENIAELLDGVYDNLPKTDYQEGTEITLSNTLKGKLDFDNGVVGIGQSSQDSTQGYQLLDLYETRQAGQVISRQGLIWTINDDGSITITGKTTEAFAYLDIYSNENKRIGDINTAYTFVLKNTTDTNLQCQWYDRINGGWANRTTSAICDVHTNDSNSTGSIIRILIADIDTTINARIYPMIVKGSYNTSTVPNYEPYTGGQASPNPSYPQEIKYVRGRNKLKVDFEAVSVNGIDFSSSEEEITIKGTTTASANTIVGQITLPKGSYTLSCTNMAYAWGTSRIEVSGTGIDTLSFFSGTLVRQLTLSQETALTFRAIVSGVGTSVNYKTKIQVEEGNEAHKWLPYNTIEEVVSGKNLSNFPRESSNGITFEGSQVTIKNPTTYKYADSWNLRNDTSLSGKTYTIYTRVNGTISSGSCEFNIGKTGNGYAYQKVVSSATGTYNNVVNVGTITLAEGEKFTSASVYTANGATADITIDFMVVEGSYNASTIGNFEPYITPTSYQLSLGDHKFYGIGTYRDYILRTTGKNLFDIADVTNDSNNGVAISKSGFDITLNGTASANTTFEYTLSNPIVLKSGDKITVSKSATAPSGTGGNITFRDSSNTSVFNTLHTSPSATYTATSDVTLTKIVFYVTSGTNINLTFRLQVERGSTASDYQPFGVGNWYKVGNVVELSARNSTIIYDTTLTNVSRFRIAISGAVGFVENGYCNYLKCENGFSLDEQHFYIFNGNLFFFMPNSIAQNLSQLETWLNSNDLKFYYPLVSPTYTPITGTLAEQLEEWWNGQTLNGTTIITSNGNLPMIIKVRGLKGES